MSIVLIAASAVGADEAPELRSENMRAWDSLGLLYAGEACEPHWDNTIGQPGMDLFVLSLAVFDDVPGSGDGPALYAGGNFTTAGGVSANRIAKWDGTAWSALGSGMSGGSPPQVWALTVFDDGSGPALYAGGTFTTAGGVTVNNIAKWDGTAWSPLGSGMNGSVRALTVFDDAPGSGGGPALYAGGFFTTAGGVPANRIAKWDGTAWSPLGSGLGGGTVGCLAVFDDVAGSGGGSALYVGGDFVTAGDVPANRIAKWDGTEWSALGSGMNDSVTSLTVFDAPGSDGGPALYAGGWFTTAGGASASRIARWDGTAWSPLGGGMGGDFSFVSILTVFADAPGSGGGPALYAGGNFPTAGGVTVNSIVKWDGTAWSVLGSGVNSSVRALAVLDDAGNGDGPALYAGGIFTTAGGVSASRIAKWQGCAIDPGCEPSDLNCDGVVDVQDLLMLLTSWGTCPKQSSCPADLNNSGTVGVQDLLILLANWG